MGFLDEMREEAREAKTPGDEEYTRYNVYEIVKGELGDSNRHFKTGAKLIYLIGEGNTDNNHVNGIKSRYGAKSGSISFGEDGKLSELESEGLIEGETVGGQKLSRLTELGEKVYERIRPLFRGLYETEELEEAIQEFENRYGRRPELREISYEREQKITEDDIQPSVKWKPPEESVNMFNIVAGFVLRNTSAEGIAGVKEGEDFLSIAFSKEHDNGDRELRRYAESNEEFLQSLDLEHLANNIFALKLDDFSEFVLDESSITFKARQNKGRIDGVGRLGF